MKRYYVYEWFNIETGEVFYIGKGCRNRYAQITGRNQFFMDYYNSHKCSSRKIYEELTEEQAFNKEIELIAYYRETSNFRLTNQTVGGDGHPFEKGKNNPKFGKGDEIKGENNPFYGKQHREETKKILSEIASTRVGENNPFYGKQHREETKRKMREKAKIRLADKVITLSEEHKKKISEGLKKFYENKEHKPLSEETKKKISETLKNKYKHETHFNLGKKHSEETKKHYSETRKGENNPNWGNGDKIKGENNPMFGKQHSEETKRKMREKAKENAKKRRYDCVCKMCNKTFKGRSWNASKCEGCKAKTKK